MADDTWEAEMIVGIDFGMTCTGVAMSMGPEWPEPKTIQRWPGLLSHELRNKVNSTISYDIHTGEISSWGFMCNPDDDRFEYNQLFKLHLDPDYDDKTEHAPSTNETRAWYQDYLSCLYRYIMKHFSDTIPRFASKKIDFVFSAPVTWRRNPTMLAKIEDIIRAAGFGQTENERAGVYLTEAEAAAIYASKQSMVKGEVFLVCDAGGGTTDLNVLKVESAERHRMRLLPLSWTEGEAIGSTVIDWKVRKIVEQRLTPIQSHIDGDLDLVVSKMMRDKFEGLKCSFGTEGMDVPRMFLPIPGMPLGMEFPDLGVEDSKIVITREELQGIFDDQVNKITSLIDQQLRIVAERHAGEKISYLVLSGGLGSSPYVQSCIKARYQIGTSGLLPGTENLQVLVAFEPQLCVVHGLVMARIQANRGGPDMYYMRCCPISFGILSRVKWDPVRHQGEPLYLDPLDKTRWAERQIRWVIKQGQLVSADFGQRHRYRFKLPKGEEDNHQKIRIVASTLPAKELPKSMRWGGAKDACVIEVKFDPRDMKRKNRHWYNRGDEYSRAEFDVCFIVGAGLKFEIRSLDGLRCQANHEIQVQWDPAPAEEQTNGISQQE